MLTLGSWSYSFFEYSDTKGKQTIGRHFHKSLLSSSSSQWSSRPGCAEGVVALWCLLLLLHCQLHNGVMLCRVNRMCTLQAHTRRITSLACKCEHASISSYVCMNTTFNGSACQCCPYKVSIRSKILYAASNTWGDQ